MKMNNERVSVVIPTMLQARRALLLQRAIDSVLNQSDVVVELLIVVNGDKYDTDLLDMVERDAMLRVLRLVEANVSLARYEGVRNATSRFFCFLDDDDELLPGSLSHRVGLFSQHEQADIVVTNGYRHGEGGDAPLVIPGMSRKIMQNTGASFFDGNWFASPAPLFKADSIDASLFNFSFKYFEWTYLFFLLLSKGRKFHYDEGATYRVYGDNPLSVSKSLEYLMAYADFLLTLKALPLSQEIRRLIQDRYVIALNSQSDIERQAGYWGKAWKSHIKCLLAGGWRYFPYTRHLLIP